MYLKELTINGFKSFAKKSDLEFSSAITAIVGPNGSGKSNIAESFRFVLGEQSVKSLRGKRGEDLIWGGSEKVSRGNRASVEVVFDNKQRVFTLDFDEVRIERIVHRDGQNEYKLNGSVVRLKDIHELLAAANIGPTGHHIISQGEADRVLAAGPKERREIIEDALGLKVYQIKKQEAERKLEKTRENIAQVESLRREAAPHLKYLKKQVEKAERSLQVQKELRVRYAEYLKREDVYVAYHHDRLEKAKREPASRLEHVVTELRKITERLKEIESQPIVVTDDSLETAHRQAMVTRQNVERELSSLDGQISFLRRRIEQANRPVEKNIAPISRQQLVELAEEFEDSVKKALGYEDVQSLREVLSGLVRRFKSFLQQEQPVVVDVSATDRAELELLEKNREAVVVMVESAVEAEERARAAKDAAKQQRIDVSEQQRAVEREMFALRAEERELTSTLAMIDRELSVLDRDRTDFKQQLQEAVSLLGRGATDYFSLEIMGDDGEVVGDEAIASEDRTIQRNRQHELEKLKIRLEELGVGATEDLLKEYTNAQERDEFLARELADLQASVENLRLLIVEMQETLREEFVTGLGRIAKEFNSFFILMFGGGATSLELVKLKVRGEDGESGEALEVEEGVELTVSLPNKRVKGLEMLSGGERALTSIALIFAMSQVNPPPFIILDETDAALDEANSRRYGDMIEALAKKSQLVLITHNRETMSRAGILYGITMGSDGASKTLSVKFDEAAAVAK